MKQYKHKTKDYLATEEPDDMIGYRISTPRHDFIIPAFMIEDSADWQPVPAVLLVTEDQKEITDFQAVVWLLNIESFGYYKDGATLAHYAASYTEPHIKFFSTSAARDEYILHNKPVLSLDDVLNNVCLLQSEIPHLKQLAKSKL